MRNTWSSRKAWATASSISRNDLRSRPTGFSSTMRQLRSARPAAFIAVTMRPYSEGETARKEVTSPSPTLSFSGFRLSAEVASTAR